MRPEDVFVARCRSRDDDAPEAIHPAWGKIDEVLRQHHSMGASREAAPSRRHTIGRLRRSRPFHPIQALKGRRLALRQLDPV